MQTIHVAHLPLRFWFPSPCLNILNVRFFFVQGRFERFNIRKTNLLSFSWCFVSMTYYYRTDRCMIKPGDNRQDRPTDRQTCIFSGTKLCRSHRCFILKYLILQKEYSSGIESFRHGFGQVLPARYYLSAPTGSTRSGHQILRFLNIRSASRWEKKSHKSWHPFCNYVCRISHCLLMQHGVIFTFGD